MFFQRYGLTDSGAATGVEQAEVAAKRKAAARSEAYRNRNANFSLPETRDIDLAIVRAVQGTLLRAGVREALDVERLEGAEKRLVALILRELDAQRFAVLQKPEARNRVWRRLGLATNQC